MKKLGYSLITLGFLAGALISVMDKLTMQWWLFLASLLVGFTGIVLLRLSDRQQKRAKGKLASNIRDIVTRLSRIVENITKLNAEKKSINPYDIHQHIDELFAEDLTAFVQNRESIAHLHGLQAYADVMTNFAAAERHLNRVWSASTDGYIDEVNTYLDKAQAQFTQALESIRQLEAKA